MSHRAVQADRCREVALSGHFDLPASLRLWSAGPGDPSARVSAGQVVRATWTKAGPATLHVRASPDRAYASAWGPGADTVLEGLESLLGTDDEPDRFVPSHPVVKRLHRVHRGLRLARAPSVFETMVSVVAQQRVTFREGVGGYRELCRRFGGRAPGPFELTLPPSAARLADAPYYQLRPLDRRRAETVRHLARLDRGRRLEDRFSGLPSSEVRRRMQTVSGVGPWTAGLTSGIALADADAVPVGDLHFPSAVTWALAGEPRGDDERMLELLEPFVGNRWRVMRLVLLGPQPYKKRLGRRSPT